MTDAEHEVLLQRFEGVTAADEVPAPRAGRESLRVFIREENKKINDTIRKLEERIINLEKLIG